ncbi:MAG: hypothetical protein ACJ786_36700 [Catenulispora sp.]
MPIDAADPPPATDPDLATELRPEALPAAPPGIRCRKDYENNGEIRYAPLARPRADVAL